MNTEKKSSGVDNVKRFGNVDFVLVPAYRDSDFPEHWVGLQGRRVRIFQLQSEHNSPGYHSPMVYWVITTAEKFDYDKGISANDETRLIRIQEDKAFELAVEMAMEGLSE